jgi:hypothetical protein
MRTPAEWKIRADVLDNDDLALLDGRLGIRWVIDNGPRCSRA